jgi:signal transduction histidine kinase
MSTQPRHNVDAAETKGDAMTRPSLRARDVVFDLLPAVVVLAAAFAPFGQHHTATDSLRVLPFSIVAAVTILARRWLPVTVLVITVLVGIVGSTLGVHTPAFTLPVAIAMYTVARRRSRGFTVVAAVLLMVLLPLEELYTAGADVDLPNVLSSSILQPAALVALAAALGSAVRSYQEALQAANERARRAEESREAEARRRVAEDRLQIARDLHDSVGHRIAVINLQAGVAARSLRRDPDEAAEAIGVIGDAARSVIAELQDMLGLLRATAGGESAAEPGLDRIDGLLALFARSGLAVQVHVRGEPRALPAEASTVAYRVVQEALTNAYKHGEGRRAELLIDYDGAEAVIDVRNPVPATGAGGHPPLGGHGLIGMRERLTAIGGRLETSSTDDGFRLVATLPAEGVSAKDAAVSGAAVSGAAVSGAARLPVRAEIARDSGSLGAAGQSQPRRPVPGAPAGAAPGPEEGTS